jgi:hypothetical protein
MGIDDITTTEVRILAVALSSLVGPILPGEDEDR